MIPAVYRNPIVENWKKKYMESLDKDDKKSSLHMLNAYISGRISQVESILEHESWNGCDIYWEDVVVTLLEDLGLCMDFLSSEKCLNVVEDSNIV